MTHPTVPAAVLVLRLSALGDCINAFGMISALRAAAPGTRILWLIDHRMAGLFRDEEGQDLIPLLEVDFKQGFLKAFCSVRKALKPEPIPLLLNIQTSFRASLISLATGCSERLGYDRERARELQRLFVTRQVPSPSDPHVLAGFMAFAEAAGFGKLEPCWDFRLSPRLTARMRVRTAAVDPLFVIAPASAKAAKNWTVDGYAAVARHAFERGFAVVLSGGPGEADQKLCAAINEALDGRATNLCGKTSLRELAALISISALVLAPDSATLHLATALNVPVIGLYAVHNPQRVGSWRFRDLQVSVYEELARRELGSRKRPWRFRVRDPEAMAHIRPEAVVERFDYALSHYLGAPAPQATEAP